MAPIVTHPDAPILHRMTAPLDRERFDRAQRRHRRNARLRAIPAALAAAAMGIPLGVYLSPVLLALAIIVTDLVNLVVPTADVGGAVSDLLDGLIDGDPSTIQAVVLDPGHLGHPGDRSCSSSRYLLVAWRLRRIGGDGIALAMGARAPRTDDAQERQLVDVVTELAVAAGIEPPRVLLYDDAAAERPRLRARSGSRDGRRGTPAPRRRSTARRRRERIARVIASAVDGDLGLAVDVGAVYVTFGLMTTGLAAIVSRVARARWRAAIGPLVGRRHDPRQDAMGIAALLALLAEDDDTPSNAAVGCLSLLTMGGIIGVGVAFINLFLSGPLLTFAWRSRGYLADATAVDLTRDADGLARALTKLGGGGRGCAGRRLAGAPLRGHGRRRKDKGGPRHPASLGLRPDGLDRAADIETPGPTPCDGRVVPAAPDRRQSSRSAGTPRSAGSRPGWAS